MAELLELEHILRSQKITANEVAILSKCKSDLRNSFLLGAFAGGAFTWAATSRLFKPLGFTITGGVAMTCAIWMLNRSAGSSLDLILSQNGTRMQKELGNILLRKIYPDPWTLQLMYKHFYCERVFSDSTVDNLTLRWRYRNIVNDYTVPEDTSIKEAIPSKIRSKINVPRKEALPSKATHAILDADLGDPLDSILGLGEQTEQPDLPGTLTPTTKQTRHHKRSHRRRRRRDNIKAAREQEV